MGHIPAGYQGEGAPEGWGFVAELGVIIVSSDGSSRPSA
ncbi:hypothetical protein QFZ35_001761 [Arthrobacter ulcerisalmonis]|nr:hypothetical protein [Arthrobacter ulcerisalmonis]MDQ0731171.1 hypothetical protein [Arthrobacter sp. B1I2]